MTADVPLSVLTRRLLDTPADFQLPGSLPPPLPGTAPAPAPSPRSASTPTPPITAPAREAPASRARGAAPPPLPDVHVRAVLADVLESREARFDAALLDRLLPPGASRNQHALTLLVAWLLAEPSLPLPADAAGYAKLAEDLALLAPELSAERCLVEDERREELARLLVGALGLLPAGESAAQARDRYTAVSTLEAVRLAGMSRAREQRAQEILAALARKAAEEAADKWSRE